MEVDMDNFDEVAPIFEGHLKKASFVAMDLEMSGISLPYERMGPGDLIPHRYQRCKRVVEKYGIAQVGFCLFEEAHKPRNRSSSNGRSPSGSKQSRPSLASSSMMEVDHEGGRDKSPSGSGSRASSLVARPFNFYIFPRPVEDLPTGTWSVL